MTLIRLSMTAAAISAAEICLALTTATVTFGQTTAGSDPVAASDTRASANAANAPGVTKADHRTAERTRIQHERAALAARRQHDESDCYNRFAVEDCLRKVRTQVREVEGRLRTQEVELNDSERREKAADRLRAIEEKQNAVSSAGAVRKEGQAKVRKPPVGSGALSHQHEQDALQRAQQQREHAQAQTREQAARASANAERAAKTRERHAQTLKAADERRARVEKANADALAQGHKPAAPLPLPQLP